MSTATPARLLTLLSLLHVRREWSGAALSERLEVSARTVRRDVDRLRELGYAIAADKGPGGGYRLEAGSDLPPLMFDDEQAIALTIALQTATLSGADIAAGAARALTTVRQVLPPRLRHRVDAVEVAVSDTPSPAADPDVLATVTRAIRASEGLRFDYDSPGRTRPESGAAVQSEPHALVAHGGRWYLVGWEAAAEDWRIRRIDRMRLRIPGGPRFTRREIPGGDAGRFLAARFKGSEGPGAWPCVGEVVLDLPAHRVLPFEPEGIVTEVAPGRTRLLTGSWSWIALAAALGRYDCAVEVVDPPELLDAFAQLAERYRQAGSRPS